MRDVREVVSPPTFLFLVSNHALDLSFGRASPSSQTSIVLGWRALIEELQHGWIHTLRHRPHTYTQLWRNKVRRLSQRLCENRERACFSSEKRGCEQETHVCTLHLER